MIETLISLLLLSSFFSPQPALSQTPSDISSPSPTPSISLFQQYQSDYLYQYSLYQPVYLTYTEKKQTHTKYGTITTLQDKIDATKKALLTKNNVLYTYLIALRVHLDEYKTAYPTATEKNQIEIKKWEDWLNEQNTVVSSLNNDTDIARWAKDFKSKYILIQQTIYAALVQNQINQKTQTLDQIKAFIPEIQNLAGVSPENQNWFSSFPVKSDLITTSFQSALEIINTKQGYGKFTNNYPQAKNELNRATNYLQSIVNDLKSIASSVKPSP